MAAEPALESSFDAGDLDAAIEQARDAVAADGTSPQACAALGFFLIQSGRLDDAAAVVLPALERNPHYAPLHWYAGYLFQQGFSLQSVSIVMGCGSLFGAIALLFVKFASTSEAVPDAAATSASRP